MSDRFETLSEAIGRFVESGMGEVRTCIPAKIVKYDAANNRADCQILVKNFYQDEQGERKSESWPVVPGVAVQFFGAGGMRLTCPISDGGGGQAATTGTLFFSFLSLDKWLSGSGSEVDPEFDHRHGLQDGIFVPGLMPFGSPWSSVPTDGSMSIGDDADGNGRIHFKSGEVNLGADATKGVARDGDRLTASSAMASWASVVETAINTLAPGTFLPANSFAGALPANPGADNNFGDISESSANIKAVD